MTQSSKSYLYIILGALLMTLLVGAVYASRSGAIPGLSAVIGQAEAAQEASPEGGVNEPGIAGNIPQPAMAVMTEAYQGYTYGPDQQVLVFVEGFQPGEGLGVSAAHETQGVVKSGTIDANQRGEAVIYHYVQPNANEDGAYPEGEITFWVTGSSGTVKSYAFRLDYDLVVQPAPFDGCGMYPSGPIQIGGAVIVWCSGFNYQDTDYQIGYSVSHNNNVLLTGDDADVLADGVGVLILHTEPGDPTGVWDITLGSQSFQIEVVE